MNFIESYKKFNESNKEFIKEKHKISTAISLRENVQNILKINSKKGIKLAKITTLI